MLCLRAQHEYVVATMKTFFFPLFGVISALFSWAIKIR